MSNLVHADVFFFITGIAVIVFASACLVLVIYLIVISREVKRIVQIVRHQVEGIGEDVEWFRGTVKKWSWAMPDWKSLFGGKSKSSSSKRKSSRDEE
jgi:hypothetical protein